MELDPSAHAEKRVVTAKQLDNGTRSVTAVLRLGGAPYEVPQGHTVLLRGTKPNGYGVLVEGTQTIDGWLFTLTENLLARAGEILCDVAVYGGGEDNPVISSETFIIDCLRSGYSEETLADSNEYSYLSALIAALPDYEVIANPQLSGGEDYLTSISIGGVKYKLPEELPRDGITVEQL